MLRPVKMLRPVLVRRVVAAADVPSLSARSGVNHDADARTDQRTRYGMTGSNAYARTDQPTRDRRAAGYS